jgi:hypothetical protein
VRSFRHGCWLRSFNLNCAPYMGPVDCPFRISEEAWDRIRAGAAVVLVARLVDADTPEERHEALVAIALYGTEVREAILSTAKGPTE